MDPGAQLGPYEIIEALGQGSMGDVYRARHVRLDREVAVKLVRAQRSEPAASPSGDVDPLDAVLHEARTAASLNHPHICTIHDVGEVDGRPFIGMELVQGETLDSMIPAAAGLPAETVVRIGRQIASALSHAHSRGVVHRDLKPANVKVLPSGDAKVLDFGIALRVEESALDEVRSAQTTLAEFAESGFAQDRIAGTLPYMAPEVLQGGGADERSDLWALGVLLYEAATGTLPFAGRTGFELTSAILKDPCPAMSEEIPAGLSAVIRRCLSKEPARRYRTAGEVQTALEVLESGATVGTNGAADELPPGPGEARGESPTTRIHRSRHLALAIVAVLLALAAVVLATDAGGVWSLLPGAASTATDGRGAETPTRLAVLPLENLSRDPEQRYFATGIHEDILTQLSKLDGVTVLARTAVLPYRDADKSLRQIAAELDAGAVLQGSVRRAGDEIRISARLVDPDTESQLWADTYDRHLGDVFAVQTEIAHNVARSLQAALSPAQEERIAEVPTKSLSAYDLYLQGREAYRRVDERENREAARLFREALSLDPDYALAWAGLADTFAQRATLFGDLEQWSDSAIQAARRAIRMDPDLAEGHKALGHAYQVQDRHQEALAAYIDALELDPDHWQALHNAGIIYYSLGRFDDAIRVFRRAVRLAPNDLQQRINLAYSYKFLKLDEVAKEWMESVLVLEPGYLNARILRPQFAIFQGDTDRGLTLAEQIVEEAPDDPWAWTGAAAMAYMCGDFDRAVEWARKSMELAPESERWALHDRKTIVGVSLLRGGQQSEGRRVLREAIAEQERMIELGGEDYVPYWHLAAAHAALGDREIGLDYLERAYETGFRFVRWPPVDPAFDGLRDAPRFREIMADIDEHVTAMRQRVVSRDRASGLPPGGE